MGTLRRISEIMTTFFFVLQSSSFLICIFHPVSCVKTVSSMKGCKCTGIVIPKLAVTQTHLGELDQKDPTPGLMNENLSRMIRLECIYLTSFPDAVSSAPMALARKSPILWHFLSESTEEI